ncbi:MAG TPA: hypothetical protein PLX18_11550 [Anaerohalosphaeraceae bacterium]|nr:hypothetical protein [Anaerohalosphaeraceae bacterium]HQG06808.1 hypothetical protein [Anaerohalosphaeraceae bacterium]HQI08477.1 hypothetical protein [Anaerohalosphaeraceae bacterium]HQJ68903.1 hypothetical protein [Anaerohalosphaeraceae bacterium]
MIDLERFNVFKNGLLIVNTETDSLTTPQAQFIEICQQKIYDAVAEELVSSVGTWTDTLVSALQLCGLTQAFYLEIPSSLPDGLYLVLVYDGSTSSSDLPKRRGILEIADGNIKHNIID